MAVLAALGVNTASLQTVAEALSAGTIPGNRCVGQGRKVLAVRRHSSGNAGCI